MVHVKCFFFMFVTKLLYKFQFYYFKTSKQTVSRVEAIDTHITENVFYMHVMINQSSLFH